MGQPRKAEFEAAHPLAFTGTGFTTTARSFYVSAADGDVGARRKRLKIAGGFLREVSDRKAGAERGAAVGRAGLRGAIYRRGCREEWGNAG